MKVLVTGANGFVGRHLVETLREKGHQVVGLSRKRPVDWDGRYVEADLGSAPNIEKALRDIDAVAHLASRVHQGNETSDDLLPIYQKEVTGASIHLAESAKRAGVRRFVYVSSVKALGESAGSILTDESSARPEDPYGKSKREAELALGSMSDSTFKVAIVRPPLVYGPGVKANFLQLMKFVDRGVPLPFASVKNRRSVVFVGNLASAIAACVDSDVEDPIPHFVSDREIVATSGLIRAIASAMRKDSRLVPFPSRLLKLVGVVSGQGGKIQRLTEDLVVDPRGFMSRFSWEPPFTQEEGIRKTVEWYLAEKSR